jgi:hypothetical protein
MVEIKLPRILQPFYCHDLVRLGKDNDGGYLVNLEDVKKSNALISFGIGTDISFEKDFQTHNNCDVRAFDGTIDQFDTTFFKGNKVFMKKNISLEDSEETASLPTILNNIVGKAFLKCDIDGFEYQIFDQLIDNSHRFSGIVIEIHDIAVLANFDLLADFIAKLDLQLIHLHMNNYSYYDHNGVITPNVIELTFTSSFNTVLKRDLTLPHRLDMPCNPDGLDFSMTF